MVCAPGTLGQMLRTVALIPAILESSWRPGDCSGNLQGISRESQGISRESQGITGNHMEPIPCKAKDQDPYREFPGNYREFPGNSREYYREYSLTLEVTGNSREFPGNFQGISRELQGISREFSGNFQGISGNYRELQGIFPDAGACMRGGLDE